MWLGRAQERGHTSTRLQRLGLWVHSRDTNANVTIAVSPLAVQSW